MKILNVAGFRLMPSVKCFDSVIHLKCLDFDCVHHDRNPSQCSELRPFLNIYQGTNPISSFRRQTFLSTYWCKLWPVSDSVPRTSFVNHSDFPDLGRKSAPVPSRLTITCSSSAPLHIGYSYEIRRAEERFQFRLL